MPPFHVALYEPKIPPNTGNIARTCAAIGCPLHLIGPLGFHMDERSVRRAGLDFWDSVEVHQHETMADFEKLFNVDRLWAVTKFATQKYTEVKYEAGDVLLFGSETFGLPPEVLDRHRARAVGIPMPAGKVRSLNLAVAVGIVVYEGLRQLNRW